MSIAQEIRNAYDWRSYDALELALRKVEALEAAAAQVRRCQCCAREEGKLHAPGCRLSPPEGSFVGRDSCQ